MKHLNTEKGIRYALVIGIIIVLNLFFTYAFALMYEAPEWDDFCAVETRGQFNSQAECEAVGGLWQDYTTPVREGERELTGFCDATYTCQQEFQSAHEEYNKYAFIFMLIVGVAALTAGSFVAGSSVVSLGLTYGGVLSLIIAALRYWGDANNLVKLFILAVALGVLLWLGAKKFNDK